VIEAASFNTEERAMCFFGQGYPSHYEAVIKGYGEVAECLLVRDRPKELRKNTVLVPL
jgi:hypothetical protein